MDLVSSIGSEATETAEPDLDVVKAAVMLLGDMCSCMPVRIHASADHKLFVACCAWPYACVADSLSISTLSAVCLHVMACTCTVQLSCPAVSALAFYTSCLVSRRSMSRHLANDLPPCGLPLACFQEVGGLFKQSTNRLWENAVNYCRSSEHLQVCIIGLLHLCLPPDLAGKARRFASWVCGTLACSIS